jgi:Tfp pilus assembly protein PilN
MALFEKKQKELNLIPEPKTSLDMGEFKNVSLLVSIAAVIMVAIVSLIVYYGSLVEESKAKEVSENLSLEMSNWQTYAPVAQQVGSLKGKIGQIKAAQSKNKDFYDKLTEFGKTIPTGVTLTNLDFKSSKLTVQAKSTDPRILYQFYEVLRGNKTFSSVNMVSLTKGSDNYALNLVLGVK